jgi:hypothetical protein
VVVCCKEERTNAKKNTGKCVSYPIDKASELLEIVPKKINLRNSI